MPKVTLIQKFKVLEDWQGGSRREGEQSGAQEETGARVNCREGFGLSGRDVT